MATNDVLVRHLSLSARSSRPALAIGAMESAERAIRRGLRDVSTGDELVIIRSLHLAIRGTVRSPVELEGPLAARLLRAVRARCEGGSRPQPSDCVVYASEAVGVAEYVRALEDHGRRLEWHHRALVHWGTTSAEVFERCVRSGSAFTGDVLAELARNDALLLLTRPVLAGVVTRVETLWLGSVADGQSTLAALPEAVFRALVDELPAIFERLGPSAVVLESRSTHRSRALEPAIRLMVLAQLFLRWPPLRAARLAREEIDALAHDALTLAAERHVSDGAQAAARGNVEAAANRASPRAEVPKEERSRAGGLVYWARLLEPYEAAFEEALPDPKLREAVRWAVARSLEDGGMPARDPLLLTFAGAATDAVLAPSLVLRERDPERFHRFALGVSFRKRTSLPEIGLCSWGDGVVAFTEDVIVDVLSESSPHDAVPTLVLRLRQRGFAEISGIDIVSTAPGIVSDALAELDVPAIPDRWRGAILTFTSCMRRMAQERHRARLRDLRAWPARRVGRTVELATAQIDRIAGGAWFGDGTLPPRFGDLNVRRVSQL